MLFDNPQCAFNTFFGQQFNESLDRVRIPDHRDR
jgi:hypothetical protein